MLHRRSPEPRSRSPRSIRATRSTRAVLALGHGRSLPREVLIERLRALLPTAVRFLVTRGS
jgi:hypothetical protein